jgi:hypothetical protein
MVLSSDAEFCTHLLVNELLIIHVDRISSDPSGGSRWFSSVRQPAVLEDMYAVGFMEITGETYTLFTRIPLYNALNLATNHILRALSPDQALLIFLRALSWKTRNISFDYKAISLVLERWTSISNQLVCIISSTRNRKLRAHPSILP